MHCDDRAIEISLDQIHCLDCLTHRTGVVLIPAKAARQGVKHDRLDLLTAAHLVDGLDQVVDGLCTVEDDRLADHKKGRIGVDLVMGVPGMKPLSKPANAFSGDVDHGTLSDIVALPRAIMGNAEHHIEREECLTAAGWPIYCADRFLRDLPLDQPFVGRHGHDLEHRHDRDRRDRLELGLLDDRHTVRQVTQFCRRVTGLEPIVCVTLMRQVRELEDPHTGREVFERCRNLVRVSSPGVIVVRQYQHVAVA